jgi:hypothetical protein
VVTAARKRRRVLCRGEGRHLQLFGVVEGDGKMLTPPRTSS